MIVETKDLTYKYGKGNALVFPDLNIHKGEQWLILGKSGSGKTTMLHLLAGFLKPTSGDLSMLNKSLADMSNTQLDSFRAKHIGVVFQQAHFLKALTVLENLRLALNLAKGKSNDKWIMELLDRLDIADKRDKKPFELSVGEQQRASIARALVHEPDILLADEPTAALDSENCDNVVRLLKELAHTHESTLLIVTHDNRLKEHFDHRIML